MMKFWQLGAFIVSLLYVGKLLLMLSLLGFPLNVNFSDHGLGARTEQPGSERSLEIERVGMFLLRTLRDYSSNDHSTELGSIWSSWIRPHAIWKQIEGVARDSRLSTPSLLCVVVSTQWYNLTSNRPGKFMKVNHGQKYLRRHAITYVNRGIKSTINHQL